MGDINPPGIKLVNPPIDKLPSREDHPSLARARPPQRAHIHDLGCQRVHVQFMNFANCFESILSIPRGDWTVVSTRGQYSNHSVAMAEAYKSCSVPQGTSKARRIALPFRAFFRSSSGNCLKTSRPSLHYSTELQKRAGSEFHLFLCSECGGPANGPSPCLRFRLINLQFKRLQHALCTA